MMSSYIIIVKITEIIYINTMAKELRDYQKRIIEIVLESKTNQIICLPTGAGKTLTAFSLANQLQETVCMIVPRIELIKQSQEAAEEFGGTDIIWADKTSITGKHLIVASKDSLKTQIEKNPKLIEILSKSILIFDECHESIKQTYNLVKKIKPIRFLGLTATPERADGLSLLKGVDRRGCEKIHKYGCFDEVVQEESVATLIKKGFLSKLDYKVRAIKGITDVKAKVGDELSDEQMMEIYDKNEIWGDFVKCYEEFALIRNSKGKIIDKRPSLGFTNTIKMAEKVVSLFVKAGYDFRVIHGGMNVKERRELIDGLASKKIDGLVNVDLLTYGFDCPPVSYAFCTRHVKSRPLWFQIVGRILRLCEGKDKAIFVDHGDCNSEFVTEESSLQILNPFVDWNSNGLTKNEKNRKRKKQRKIQDILDFINEINPHPTEMVTVATDSLFDQLYKMVRLNREELALNRERISELEKINSNQQEENENLRYSFEKTAQKLQDTEQLCNSYSQKISELESQMEKYGKESEKVADLNGKLTHDFCRRNYAKIRSRAKWHLSNFDRKYKSTSDFEQKRNFEHQKTIDLLLKNLKKETFDVNVSQFNQDMNWWSANFEER